jgi:Cu(I)/Ag(I) efflux system membrane protein CusA/SilA
MIASIIESVLRWRLVVGLIIAAGVAFSLYAVRTASLDAIPDISDPQIIVYAKWPRTPELLETEVTEPVIKSLAGSPDIQAIRATSHMGFSFIYVILRDESRRAQVRQLVMDRINAIRPQLPADALVTLGPNASSMGWIYQYALVDKEGTRDLRELRLLNENQIKPALQTVTGVAEVASVGGLEKQYQLRVFPPLLAATGISLRQLVSTLEGAFQDAGGRTLEVTNRDYQIRGVVNNGNIDSLELMVIGRAPDGKPIHLKDIGYIQVGYDQRRGIADLDGNGEVVGGIVVMEQKQNVLAVTDALAQKLAEITPSLPVGIEIVTTYDRSNLIWSTLEHYFMTLISELVIVILVMAFFLHSPRTAIAPVAVLLLGVLYTFMPLAAFGQTINLFSLAGLFIAIGEMVDATIVIVENCSAELAARPGANAVERRRIIVRSIANVARPLLFSLLIILASFLPVFFLGEKEGRMFDPLAFSKTFAMAFSTVLTLVLLPIIIVWIFKSGNVKPQTPRELAFVDLYRRGVRGAIRHRYVFLGVNVVLLVAAIVAASGFRKDFMPQMEEGSILYMPTTLPGIPAREAGWILQQIDKKLAAFPEVRRVFGKLGRADTATDSAPVAMIETTVLLKPQAEWRPGMTKDRLVAEMDAAMKFVGFVNMWVQPISARVVMQDTGISTPVGIKIKGNDVAAIEDIGRRIETALRTYPGTQSVIAERISSGYFIDVQFDPVRLAAAGISADEAMPIVRYAIGGDNVVAIKEANSTPVPLSVQYSPEYLDSLEKVRNTPVVAAGGSFVTLGEIADVRVRNLPEMIRNDNGTLAGYVYVYLTGNVSPTDYVAGAQPFLAQNLDLPAGFSLEWTGDYQYSLNARAQLQWIVPLTLAIIFVLLLLAFHSVIDSLLIMLSVPFALVGGVFLQWVLGYSMTTAVVIGYIALFAVAIQTGIIMIVFIRQALARKAPDETYVDAVLDGSVMRLRPKLMTVAATLISLLPVMVSTGPGIEIMKPIATPTVGGMVSSTLYVLFLIPCLFVIGEDIRRFQQRSPLAARARAWLAAASTKSAAMLRWVENKQTAGLLIVIFAFLLSSSSGPFRPFPSVIGTALAADQIFPEGREKALMLEHCETCHTLEAIAGAGGTEEGWTDRINRMIRWGSKIPREDVPRLAGYLASVLPPRPDPAQAP